VKRRLVEWWCGRVGHKWVHGKYYSPKLYVCKRCGEPGFWIEDAPKEGQQV
jgi:hypothetical protein